MLVPENPNNQQRQEVAKAKADSNTESNKPRFAAVCAAIVLLCSLIATWAAATNHYTTLAIVVIVGIANAGLATWLGWPPKKIARRTSDLLNQLATKLLHSSQSPTIDDSLIPSNEPSQAEIIQAEYDRLAQKHVWTELQLERALKEKKPHEYETTSLQHNNSVDEMTAKAPTVEDRGTNTLLSEHPTDNDRSIRRPPFSNGLDNLRKNYTEQVFPEVSEDILWRWGYNEGVDDDLLR